MTSYFSRLNLITSIIMLVLVCLAFLTDDSLISVAYFGRVLIDLRDRLQ